MSESDLYEELLILEDELIDRYVRGQMSEADRASFEKYFLQSSEHRQKLRFARSLSKYVDRAAAEAGDIEPEAVALVPIATESPNTGHAYSHAKSRRFSFWPFRSPVLNYGIAFVLLIAISGLAWIALKSFRPTGPGRVFEATLVPGGITREGGEIQTITVPAGTDTLRLRLILPVEPYREYKVELIASDGSLVLMRDRLTPTDALDSKSLFVDVPATALKRDNYRIKLGGTSAGAADENIASFSFRILSR